jgi:hypothetical protein
MHWNGAGGARVLWNNIMLTNPLDLAAGIGPRLGWAALLLAGLWAGVAWALAA